MNNPEFQIFQSTVNYQFYSHLNTRNSEIILRDEGYTTKQGCQNGINSVKQNATYDSSYDHKTANDGTFYITLKASNGEIIGVSEMYNSSCSRDMGINTVKLDAPKALVEYLALVKYAEKLL